MPDVIIPVQNEAAALPGLLSAVPAGYRVTVVDNGSSDDSAEVAARLGAQVVHELKLGFGAGCWAGLTAAAPSDEAVCFMDGDGSLDPAELPRWPSPSWPATMIWSSAPVGRAGSERGRCTPGSPMAR